MAPDQSAAYVKSKIAKRAKVAKTANIRADWAGDCFRMHRESASWGILWQD